MEHLRRIRQIPQNDILIGFLDLLLEKRWYLLGGFGAFIGLVLFLEELKGLIVVLSLGTIASFSTVYKKIVRMPPFLELMTLTTIWVGIMYGPLIGAMYGMTVQVLAEVINTCIDAFIIGYVPARAAVGATSGWLYGLMGPEPNFILFGMAMSLIYNLVGQPLYMLQRDIELQLKAWTFIIGNLFFNFILYATVGTILTPLVLSLA